MQQSCTDFDNAYLAIYVIQSFVIQGCLRKPDVG